MKKTQPFTRKLRHAAFSAVSALVLLSAAGAAVAEPRHFEVQAQPLSAALLQWADQAGIEIIFDKSLTAGLATSGVTGSKEPAEALESILRGSGLTFDWSGAGTVAVRRKGEHGAGVSGALQPTATSQDLSNEVSGVTVVGSRAAQAAALNKERQASGITNVVSSDDVGRFPDNNAAEAVRRLPGVSIVTNRGEGRFVSIRGAEPSFVGVSVDGVNLPSQEDDRSVALDNVPAEQLGSIEVSKTTTPNQDAEGIGGRVNLVTKSAFDFHDHYLALDAGVGGAQQNSDRSVRASAVVAERFGADEQFGALLSASFTKFPRGFENANVSDWSSATVGGVAGKRPAAVQIEDRSFTRKRIGLSGRLEYRAGDSGRLYVAARYNTFDLSEYRDRSRVDLNAPSTASNPASGVFADALYLNHSITKTWDFVETDQQSYNVSLGGDHVLAGGKLDFQVSYAAAREDSIADEMDFRGTGFNSRLTAGKYSFGITPSGGADRNNPANFSYNQSDNRTFDRQDEETAAQLNWTRDADLLGMQGTFKAGLKITDRDKSSDTQRTRFDRFNPGALLLSDPRAGGSGPPLDSLDGYQFGPGFSHSAMRQLTSDLSVFRPIPARSFQDSLLGDYAVNEKVRAGYAMYTGKAAAWTVIAGVRVEATDTKASFWQDRNAGQAANDPTRYAYTTQDRSYTDWFPSLTVRYDATDDLVLRAAVTTSIARPKFGDLAAAREVDLSSSTLVEIDQGNPDLKPIRSTNIDLRADWYFSKIGLLSAALFHKELDGPIYQQTTPTTYEGRAAELNQPLNAGKGKITGLEVALTRQFDFLPGALSGLGVYANATVVDSSVDVPERAGESLALFNQSNLVGNLALTYQGYGFDGRIALNHQGGYLSGLSGPGKDSYIDKRTTVDFSARYSIRTNITFFVEAENLTDTPLRQYKGSSATWASSEYYGRSVLAGVGLTF